MKTVYCVTFNHDGKMWYGVNERARFGDNVPTGVLNPEPRCAMDESKARKLYEFFKKQSSFKDIALRKLTVK